MTILDRNQDDYRSTALIVCPSGAKLEHLRRLADDLPAVVEEATDCAGARKRLRQSPGPDLVITAATLPDGNWESLLRVMIADGDDGSIVVAANSESEHFRDELTARGAYGPISQPFSDQARGVLRDAWCEGRARRLGPRMQAATS